MERIKEVGVCCLRSVKQTNKIAIPFYKVTHSRMSQKPISRVCASSRDKYIHKPPPWFVSVRNVIFASHNQKFCSYVSI